MGTVTGASWKDQENLREPKQRGISLVPAHQTEDPSAVLSSTELENTELEDGLEL